MRRSDCGPCALAVSKKAANCCCHIRQAGSPPGLLRGPSPVPPPPTRPLCGLSCASDHSCTNEASRSNERRPSSSGAFAVARRRVATSTRAPTHARSGGRARPATGRQQQLWMLSYSLQSTCWCGLRWNLVQVPLQSISTHMDWCEYDYIQTKPDVEVRKWWTETVETLLMMVFIFSLIWSPNKANLNKVSL